MIVVVCVHLVWVKSMCKVVGVRVPGRWARGICFLL